MKRRSGHAATELIHNWSGSRDAMKCCAAINRVMTFTSGDGATHECNTTVIHFKGFMCIFQSHSGTVEANAHSNANCKHKALLLWAVWAIWVTNYCTLFFIRCPECGRLLSQHCPSLFLKNIRRRAKIPIDYSYLSLPVFLSCYLYSTHLFSTVAIKSATATCWVSRDSNIDVLLTLVAVSCS